MKEIVQFDYRLNAVLEAFEEALTYRELSYSLNGLKRYGFLSDTELLYAIKRAMGICNCLGIPTRNHFRYFFKVDGKTKDVIKQWKASKLGFYLVLCNGAPNNPFAGALQMEMLQHFLSKLE